MCYLRLSKHYSMRHYSRNVRICVIPNILLLCQSTHRVSITFLRKTMRMGMMGVHPSGLHHLGDMCLIRHLRFNHCLKTRAKVKTLIPWFRWDQPLQDQLLLSSCPMTFTYVPKTPSQLSPSRDDPDALHGFFNLNPDPCFDLYDKKVIFYENRDDPTTPSQIRYNYMRHGRQLSWDWHNPTTEHFPPEISADRWYSHGGHVDLDDSVFEEFF